MTKRFKVISLFSCLILCIAMIGFGVYAATTVRFSVTARVSFTPTDAYLQILGYIDGLSTDSADNNNVQKNYYAANYSSSGEVNQTNGNYTRSGNLDTFATWTWGDLILDAGKKGEVNNENNGIIMNNMTVYIQITNFAQSSLKYTVSLPDYDTTNDKITGTNLQCRAYYYIANNTNSDVTGGTNGFYNINPVTPWSTSNKPSSAPSATNLTVNDIGIHSTNPKLINTSVEGKTIMLKFVISPKGTFDKAQDMSLTQFRIAINVTQPV